MESNFVKNIEKNQLISENDNILVAVSGGVDSMVLASLLEKCKYKIAIAHINHKMRDLESELDAELVKDFAKSIKVPFHSTLLPEQFKNEGNFQEQARNFRYSYLQTLCEEYNYQKIATAHHLDDDVETFFIQLLRASGINGLSGILPHREDSVIRPLLPFTKKNLYEYAANNNIPFREDLSNQEDKYLRNYIRLKVMPVIDQMDKDAINNISRSVNNLKETEELLDSLLDQSNFLLQKGESLIIDAASLIKHPEPSFLLYYLTKKFGFNRDQTDAVFNSVNNGAKAHSLHYELRKERSHFEINEINVTVNDSIQIFEPTSVLFDKRNLSFMLIQANEISFQKSTEYLGFELNPFPLILRNRKNGDEFSPIGMKGRNKTLKKFFIDEKISAKGKEEAIIVVHKNEICAVLPYRISEKYKVRPESKFILKIEMDI